MAKSLTPFDGPNDVAISGLPAVVTAADTDVLPVVNGGATKKLTLTQLTAYIESRGRQTNASVAQQTLSTADVYLTGSDVTIPAGRLQAKSMYRMKFEIAKTSVAGTAAPVLSVRLGTAGTTADTARCTLTFAAQTAVADEGFIDLYCTWRVIGASAVLQAAALLDHRLAATGLSVSNSSIAKSTSATFDSTVANLRIGCSVNFGASFAGTTNLVQAELMNLA